MDSITALTEQFRQVISENEELREGMDAVRAQLAYEDAGWKLVGDWNSGEHLEGLDLEEVHMISERLAPRVAAGSLFKRAVDIHAGWTFGRGMFVEGTEKPKGPGSPSKLRSFFTKTENQESVFSSTAQTELQKARFIDGNVLAAVNTKTGTVNRIPFNQITAIQVDPDFPENIIAYKRKWDTKDGSKDTEKERWYYTKRFSGTRKRSFTSNGKTVPVAQDVTIVDLRANRQPGHSLGVPDGLAGMHWAESYAETLRNGMVVVESLARILFQVTNKTKKGAQDAGVKIAQFDGHGGAASMAAGQELTAVSTAGRSYAFSENRPIAAMAAAAWNVSLTDLLSDVSASGSSYGSAQALQPSLRNAMLLMQSEWASFYKDIFELSVKTRPSIVFEPFETPDKYRDIQAITLGAVALHPQEHRMAVLDTLDIVGNPADIPEGLKVMATQDSTNTSAGVQQASPNQGQNNPSGAAGSTDSNDIQNDTIGESLLTRMQVETMMDRMDALIERLAEVENRP